MVHSDVYEESVHSCACHTCREMSAPRCCWMKAGPYVETFWVPSLISKPAWLTDAWVAQGTSRTLRLSVAPCPSTRASAPMLEEAHPTGEHQPSVVSLLLLLLLNPSKSCCKILMGELIKCNNKPNWLLCWFYAHLDVKCPFNMEFSESGSPCMDTCSHTDTSSLCVEHKMDGCFCPPG